MANAIPVIENSKPVVVPVPKQFPAKAPVAETLKAVFDDAMADGKKAVLSEKFVRVDN